MLQASYEANPHPPGSPLGATAAAQLDDLEWAERSLHWNTTPKHRPRYRIPHQQVDAPLVLCGHGVSLSVKGGALAVRTGLTHYPQERETLTLFKGATSLPSKIIMLDGSGSLSFDVMSWLSEQRISLVRISWQGEAVSILGGGGTPFDADRVGWQIATRDNEEARLAFCRALIVAKLRASIPTLKTVIPGSQARDRALAAAETMIGKLRDGAGASVRDLLPLEAHAAGRYFLAWRGLPIRWKGLKQRPIPPVWHNVTVRRSHSAFRNRASSRNATHPVNAMLNYGYAVLHSQVQTELVAAGYDPRRGLMHESRQDSCALVLDMIEPRRPFVDAAILKFVTANAFSAADFVIMDDGVCRLTPQLARRVAQISAEASRPALAAVDPFLALEQGICQP